MNCIVSYGSGEVLYHVFNAIAILMNSKSGDLFKPIMMTAAIIGAFWVLSKAFFECAMEGLATRWLIPFVIFYGVLLVPIETINIRDPISAPGKLWKVDNVPLLLARTAQTFSSIGHKLTTAIEKVFSLPDNIQYNKTGHIFGSENLLEMSNYAITDENLSNNMRHFVQQCVTYDVMLGRYTMEELRKSTDIWRLIRVNTSKVRSFPYCQTGQRNKCHLVSCQIGAQSLDESLKQQTNIFKKNEILKNLPFAFEGLTAISKSAEELINQQIMMHTIVDAIERKCDGLGLSSNFAVRRAYMQQRQNYEIAGALAGKSLVVLRNVIEALIYASFMFIMPLLLLPFGFKILMTWLGLMAWIQLWPPLYAILNYIVTICAQMRFQKLFSFLEPAQIGLSFFTSTGITNLSYDMQAIAGYLSLSIPFICYAILRGGISSFAQFSGSVMSVSQGAASNAANELLTGNYSFGNVSYDTQNAFAQRMLSHHSAPNLSSGFFTENAGLSASVYSDSGLVINESISQLPFDLQGSKMIATSLRKQSQDMFTLGESQRSQAGENFNESMRYLGDLTKYVGSNKSYDHTMSEGHSNSIQKIAQETLRKAENWGKQYGLDRATATELIASVSTGGKAFLISGSLDSKGISTARQNEVIASAKNFAQESGLNKQFQTMINFAKDKRYAEHDDEGKRLSEGVSVLYDKAQNYTNQYEKTKQQSESYSKMADYAENKSISLNNRYNQEFVEWLSKDQNSYQKAQDIIRNKPEVLEVAQENFMKLKEKQLMSEFRHLQHDQTNNMSQKYQPIENTIRPQKMPYEIPVQLESHKNVMRESYNKHKNHVDFKIKSDIESEKNNMIQRVEKSQDKWTLVEASKGIVKKKQID